MKRFIPVVLILVLLSAGVTGYLQIRQDDVPNYLTAPVARGNLTTYITTTGTLNAVVTVKVGSQLSGQISELLVDFNDDVVKDQPLARLDPQSFSARVREAAAEVEMAPADWCLGSSGNCMTVSLDVTDWTAWTRLSSTATASTPAVPLKTGSRSIPAPTPAR